MRKLDSFERERIVHQAGLVENWTRRGQSK